MPSVGADSVSSDYEPDCAVCRVFAAFPFPAEAFPFAPFHAFHELPPNPQTFQQSPDKQNKVITTTLIRPLDDPTYFARYPLANLKNWTKLRVCMWHHCTANLCVIERALLTDFAYLDRSVEICKGDFSNPGLGSYGGK